ncbi:MAG: glycosyltransferase family 2 protein [Crocinitomicaceae bacterium]
MFQLSIITINFNNREGLTRTFESVFNRKVEGIEYLVIDADSTDGSKELIAKNKDKIDHSISEKDKGIYDGMNKGIAFAKGKYVIFINSGDLLIHENILKLIEENDQDIIYGNTKIQYPNGFEREALASPKEELWKSLPFVHQSVIVKGELLKNNHFDLNYKYCSDYELFCRLESKNTSWIQLNETIAQIEAGGLSDEKRDQATTEVFEISSKYRELTEDQKNWFRKEISKGKRVQRIKKFVPNSLLKFALRIKYRK